MKIKPTKIKPRIRYLGPHLGWIVLWPTEQTMFHGFWTMFLTGTLEKSFKFVSGEKLS